MVENYPQLKATENFQTLQAQLEGTENRIAFERKKYNDVARAFNTRRDTVPTVLIAGMFGSRFNEKPYFQAQPGAERAAGGELLSMNRERARCDRCSDS